MPGSRFRNVVVESISSRERGKSGCGSVLIGEESHGFVFEEKRATHWKERSLVTTVSHFSLYFAAKANEEEQRDRAQGVQSTRRAESQDIPSGNFSSEFSFDRAIFFVFLKIKIFQTWYYISSRSFYTQRQFRYRENVGRRDDNWTSNICVRIIAERVCCSFAGARANKDGHREPESASLGRIIGFRERRARKYRDSLPSIGFFISRRGKKIRKGKKDEKRRVWEVLLRSSTSFGRFFFFL